MKWIIYSFAAAGFFTFAGSLITAIFIFLNNPRSKINRLFSLFVASVSIYGFGFFRQALSSTPSQEMVSIKILLFGTILIPIFFLHAIYAILNKKISKPILFTVYLTATIFEIINLFTDFFARDPIPKFGLQCLFQAGPLYPVIAAYFAVCISVGLWQLFIGYRNSIGVERNRLKYLFFGMLAGFSGGSVGFLLGYNINLFPLNPFTTYSVILGNILMAYAIVKYRLLDINVVLTRAGIFAIVYTFVLGIPFGFAGWGRAWLMSLFGQDWFWVPMFLLLGFATAGPFLYTYFRRRTEDILLKDQRRYQATLLKLSTTLTLVKDLERLLKLIVYRVSRAVKVEFACVYAGGKDGRYVQKYPYVTIGFFPALPAELPHTSALIASLQEHGGKPVFADEIPANIKKDLHLRGGIIIPSFVRQRLLGFLVMGPKSSGALYSPDDTNVFRILAGYVGLAIENTQFLKELEEVHAKLVEAEKLKGIAQMMHSLNHELRNIFNKMSVPVQMIELGEFDNNKDAFDNALKTVSVNVDLGAEILAYVQSYSAKSESNELKPNNVEEAIHKAITHFSQRFKDAGIAVIKQIQPNLPTIQAKETFDDLFKNILANCYFAITDQPREQKLIDIQVKLSDDKNTIQIRISDTGPDMTKITSYTAEKDSPFKERGKIGGVNLFLAYLIANDHNSKLTFESYEKGGTTFILNIAITKLPIGTTNEKDAR